MSRRSRGKSSAPPRAAAPTFSFTAIAGGALLAASPYFLSDFSVEKNLWFHFAATGFVVCDLLGRFRNSSGARERGLGIWLALFIAVHFASLAWSAYRFASVLEAMRVLDCALLAWVLTRQVRSFESALPILAGVVLGAAMVGRQAAIEQRTSSAAWRAFATFQNPNLLAFYLAMVLPLYAGTALALRSWLNARAPLARMTRFAIEMVATGAGVLIVLGLHATGSRGGLVAATLGIGSFLLVALFRVSQSKSARRVGAAILLLGILGVGIVVARISERARQTATSADHSVNFRLYTWRGTFALIRSRPITGVGAGTFQHAYPRFAITGFTRHAHQNYLQVFAETGLVGISLFAGFLVVTLLAWRRGLALISISPEGTSLGYLLAGLGGSMVAFLAHSLVDSGWYLTSITLLFLTVARLTAAVAEADPHSQDGREQIAPAGPGNPRFPGSPFLRLLPAGLLVLSLLPTYTQVQAEQRFLEAGRLRQAGSIQSLVEAREAVELNPLSGEYRNRLGNLLRETYRFGGNGGHYSEARGAYRSASRLMSTSAIPLVLEGHLHRVAAGIERDLHTEHLRAAVRAYRDALARDPHNTDAVDSLGQTLVELGETEAARRTYQSLASLYEGPWGQFPAVPEIVDIHVARAFVGLVALSKGNTPALPRWKRRARELIDTGLMYEKLLWSKVRAQGMDVAPALGEDWKLLDRTLRDL